MQAEKHAAMEEAEGFHEDVTGVTFQARSASLFCTQRFTLVELPLHKNMPRHMELFNQSSGSVLPTIAAKECTLVVHRERLAVNVALAQ